MLVFVVVVVVDVFGGEIVVVEDGRLDGVVRNVLKDLAVGDVLGDVVDVLVDGTVVVVEGELDGVVREVIDVSKDELGEVAVDDGDGVVVVEMVVDEVFCFDGYIAVEVAKIGE